jgi:hypothetical protein
MGSLSLMHWVMFALLLIVFAAINFVPTFVAFGRLHQHRVAIFVVNFFVGWTGIGWVICLVWALTAVRPAGPQ